MSKLFFKNALLPDGWAKNVIIEVNADGFIASVGKMDASAGRAVDGAIALPGLANLHSHAFQRAMAGLGEWRGAGDDDFWSWRNVMYRFVERLRPEDLRAVATQLYIEMLEAGFTSVGEFHYLHHQPDGTPYDDVAEMAGGLIEAARTSGIGLTLLPVAYAFGDFGGQPLDGAQLRFRHDTESFLRLYERCREMQSRDPHGVTGIAPHSLRAVSPEMLTALVAGAPDGPIHIHIAEQEREVDASLAWSGAPPVEWLLDNQPVDDRWCLVHATHMSADEVRDLAATGAVAGLCPSTEANLGDGIFDGVAYGAAGGAWGLGTDSHIRVDVAEELRLLEYSQRLRDRRRLRLAAPGEANGRRLYESAVSGGATALGRGDGAITPGARADIVTLDADHPALIGREGDDWLNSWIFSGDKSVVCDVWSAGRRMVKNGVHTGRAAAVTSFRQAMRHLTA